MAVLRSEYHHSNTETLATPLLSRALNHSIRHALVATQYLCIKASKATKDLGLRPSYKIQTCYKIQTWCKRRNLASGPLWSPPPSTRSWPPHNHLYSSPKRFPVESQLWLGCSHKIPNRASVTSKLYCRDAAVHSMALGLSQCSTVPSNTILGPCSQGPSRHVLPHAAPGFFVGREYKGWWSSPNFASILLAPRDDILALCSGGRTQSHGVTILSSGVAMVFSLDLSSHGSRPPIYSNGAQHRSPFTSQMAW
jgi:hypothetical protein